MKISLRWLKEYVNPGVTPQELGNRLTMAGLETKGIQVIGEGWENVIVARLKAINPHPNADRLRLATVDLGDREMTVVCGAPNLTVGDKVPFAKVGACLRDGHSGEKATLKPARIRGVVSEGMVCSEKELGISDDYSGIMVLPEDAPVGSPLADYLGDVILEVEITPNRADCMSLLGIAREAAALTGQKIHIPPVYYEESDPRVHSYASVEIAAPDLCPRYCCTVVTGVKVGPSPAWLQRRLANCGMRPINNIVDATNYVMLEYGQPLHAFDYDMLAEKKIFVRRAGEGEIITSIDGSERKLTPDMLVIADARHPVAVAGVMGGYHSEIAETTKTVLLESANFNAAGIRRTSSALRLRTEASIRFERNLSRELPMYALKRVTQLVVEMAGGRVAAGLIDAYPGRPDSDKKMLLDAGQIRQLLGMDVADLKIEHTLESLGFTLEKEAGETLVTPPYWRTDINFQADLAEEVARVMGYDAIPVTQLSTPIPTQDASPRLALRQSLREAMTGCGFQEVLTYSLTNENAVSRLDPAGQVSGPRPLRVANPLTRDQEELRTTLRANLLGAFAHNQKYESSGIRLFEIGKVFLPQGKGQPKEIEMMCAVLGGSRQPLSWRDHNTMDFFDARGTVEAILCRLGLKAEFAPASDHALYAGRAAGITIDGRAIGVLGELDPRVAANFELNRPVMLVEMDLEALQPAANVKKRFQPLPRYPAMERDVAIVVGLSVTWEQVLKAVQGSPLVTSTRLFDIYTGAPVPPDNKSLAFRIVYQSPAHTLTDEEVSAVHQQIIDKLGKDLGATLR